MGRPAFTTTAGGTPTGCIDSATGNPLPNSACCNQYPNYAPGWCSQGAAMGIVPTVGPMGRFFRINRSRNRPAVRNFLDLQSFTQPKTIVPVVMGAAVFGIAGNLISKKTQIKFLGKYNKLAMIIAGVGVGALAGKFIADMMASSQEVLTVLDPNEAGANATPMEKIQETALQVQ